MEFELYADHTWQSQAERRNTLDDAHFSSENELKTKKHLVVWRWALAGMMCLLFLLLVVALSLMSLYLQVNYHLFRIQKEMEDLRQNQSRGLMELDEERACSIYLSGNLSAMQQAHQSLENTILFHLTQNLTHYQRQIQDIKLQRQAVHQNYSALRKEYNVFMERNILIPRSSAFLNTCQRNDSDNNILVCHFCPSKWQLFGLSCYLRSSGTKNWMQGGHWCRTQGGYLAVINSEKEQVFLKSIVGMKSWIGLSDHEREGYWRWIDGTPYDKTPRFWSRNPPKSNEAEDCVTLSAFSMWDDEDCNRTYLSVCERTAAQIILKGHILSN
ncbi:Hypothetical predicted protein [Pelobates cultripes]|uniref:C-type lectin domain-containing protein n=1 Tax=Pelobates cultripes TaxID=61616 RepID=A0AAD1TBV6_PELCU|nr:Hypothetical predicted protein [Pelobates cultripes]